MNVKPNPHTTHQLVSHFKDVSQENSQKRSLAVSQDNQSTQNISSQQVLQVLQVSQMFIAQTNNVGDIRVTVSSCISKLKFLYKKYANNEFTELRAILTDLKKSVIVVTTQQDRINTAEKRLSDKSQGRELSSIARENQQDRLNYWSQFHRFLTEQKGLQDNVINNKKAPTPFMPQVLQSFQNANDQLRQIGEGEKLYGKELNILNNKAGKGPLSANDLTQLKKSSQGLGKTYKKATQALKEETENIAKLNLQFDPAQKAQQDRERESIERTKKQVNELFNDFYRAEFRREYLNHLRTRSES